jgi:hypothetical protein
MIIIDKTTYSTNNYYPKQFDKKQIVLDFSFRKSNFHIVRLQTKTNKEWNTYTVSREGLVYQHYDDKFYTDFIDIKENDKISISIVLENMGYLYYNDNTNYYNWLNEKCDKDSLIIKRWLDFKHWENIPNIQIENTALLCNEICDKHGINKSLIDFLHYHEDIKNFNGICFKSNHIYNYPNIHPYFNLESFSHYFNLNNGLIADLL